MGAVGGSSGSLSLNGRSFSIDGEADIAQSLVKFENEMKANGDGTFRLIKKRKPLMLEGLVIAVDDSRGDIEFLSDLNDNGDGNDDGLFPYVYAAPSGAIYSGRGQTTSDLKRQTQESTAELTLQITTMKKQ